MPCLRRSLPCSYRPDRRSETGALRRQLGEHRELVRYLRSLPEHEAIELLRLLRATAAPVSAVLASVVGPGAAHSSLLHRPPDLKTARWVRPPTETTTELELMASHPAAYLKIESAPRFRVRVPYTVSAASDSSRHSRLCVPRGDVNDGSSAAAGGKLQRGKTTPERTIATTTRSLL